MHGRPILRLGIAISPLFNHFVGGREQKRRNAKAEFLCHLQVDGQLDFRRLLHRNVGRFDALQHFDLNLIGNGFYAVDKRRRREGEAFRPRVKVTTRDLPDAVEITIQDNGVGIPPQHRQRLFQPFFTTKPTGEGTGLGLSISYDIVTQQHGGTITVDSEPGQFTEFRIRLPRRR